MRRRVSFEGERLAERTVENIAETQEDHTYFQLVAFFLFILHHSLCSDSLIDWIFLCSGKPYGKTFFGRMTGSGRKSNPNNNSFTESSNPMR